MRAVVKRIWRRTIQSLSQRQSLIRAMKQIMESYQTWSKSYINFARVFRRNNNYILGHRQIKEDDNSAQECNKAKESRLKEREERPLVLEERHSLSM